MGNPSPPLAVITPDDHRGYIHIANAFGLCLILLFTLIRVSVRLLISPPFQYDDVLLFTSTVCLRQWRWETAR